MTPIERYKTQKGMINKYTFIADTTDLYNSFKLSIKKRSKKRQIYIKLTRATKGYRKSS